MLGDVELDFVKPAHLLLVHFDFIVWQLCVGVAVLKFVLLRACFLVCVAAFLYKFCYKSAELAWYVNLGAWVRLKADVDQDLVHPGSSSGSGKLHENWKWWHIVGCAGAYDLPSCSCQPRGPQIYQIVLQRSYANFCSIQLSAPM